MPAKIYWIFTTVYWLIAGLLLFINALGIDHWPRVTMRFLYFPVLGILIASAKTLIYETEFFRRLHRPLIGVLLLSFAGAVVTGMILNPITYLILGIDISERHIERMTSGWLVFTLFYLLWSVLYLQFIGRPMFGRPAPDGDHLDRIGVDDRGERLALSVADIECLAASGDYVEIHLADRQFLKKATISSLESRLDPSRFRRVHRSTIVNLDKIARIAPRGSGAYELTLDSGRTVATSRSYRSVVTELQS